jgi:hypothetical protein
MMPSTRYPSAAPVTDLARAFCLESAAASGQQR